MRQIPSLRTCALSWILAGGVRGQGVGRMALSGVPGIDPYGATLAGPLQGLAEVE